MSKLIENKVKLTNEQKKYFLDAYMENELANCLSYNQQERLKYLGVTSDKEIESVLFDNINELVVYVEDVVYHFDDMYIECLNPDIKNQEEIIIVNDSDKENIKVIKVSKQELLKHVDEDFIKDVIVSGEYYLGEKVNTVYGEAVDNLDELKLLLDRMKIDYKLPDNNTVHKKVIAKNIEINVGGDKTKNIDIVLNSNGNLELSGIGSVFYEMIDEEVVFNKI